jgi:hypothetical protein
MSFLAVESRLPRRLGNEPKRLRSAAQPARERDPQRGAQDCAPASELGRLALETSMLCVTQKLSGTLDH